jgi:hypothetical protein
VQGFLRDGDRGQGTYLPYLPCGSRGTSVPSYLRTSAVPSRSSIVDLDKGLSHPCRSLVEHLIFDLWSQPALPCSSSSSSPPPSCKTRQGWDIIHSTPCRFSSLLFVTLSPQEYIHISPPSTSIVLSIMSL